MNSILDACLKGVSKVTKRLSPVTVDELDKEYNKHDKEVIIDADGNVTLNLGNKTVQDNFWMQVKELSEIEKRKKEAR